MSDDSLGIISEKLSTTETVTNENITTINSQSSYMKLGRSLVADKAEKVIFIDYFSGTLNF